MLLDSIFAKVLYKLFALAFSLYWSISGPIVMPSKQTPIKPENPNATLVFAAIADPQVSNCMYDRYSYFMAAAEDLRNATDLDAIVMAGDITENGFSEEFQLVLDELGGIDTRFIACVGNHDIRLKNYKLQTARFNNFVNALNGDTDADGLHHSERVKGYKFIVMGTDRMEIEESYISPEQLQWLDNELAQEKGKPTFVIIHQPLKDTHGLPLVWNHPDDTLGTVGPQSDDIREILNKHKNVILISGHEHTGFGKYTYEKIGNFHSVNLPGLTPNNAFGEYNEHGLGFIVEVTKNTVLFRARDMRKGFWLPQYDIEIKY